MKKKSVCFTGHRSVKETAELKNNLLKTACQANRRGAYVFCAGGAVG